MPYISDDSTLRRLKADHLKKRADQALRDGDFRLAWEKYGEAIETKPDKDGLAAVYSNRSLAYARVQRYNDALRDADAAIRLAPQWSKAHWRRGAALIGLKDGPRAAQAYLSAWELANRDSAERKECDAKLWQAVQLLTREQLGAGFLRLFDQLQQKGAMRGPEVESVSEAEMLEGWHRLVRSSHQGQPPPGPFYHRYRRCLQQGLPPAEAYTLRAAIYSKAKCYLQARRDAQAAVTRLCSALQQATDASPSPSQRAKHATNAGGGGGSGDAGHAEDDNASRARPQHTDNAGSAGGGVEGLRGELGAAYVRLGEALLAEPDHEDRDCLPAFKALTRATEVDPGNQEARDLVQEASEGLTKEQLERAALEVYNGGSPFVAPTSAAGGALRPGERIFRVEAVIAFPSAEPKDVGSRAREVLRKALAEAAGVDPLAVTLERVHPARPPARPYLTVGLHVTVGPMLLRGNALVKAFADAQQLTAAVGGQEIVQLLGPPNAEHSSAELADVTPACIDSEAQHAQRVVVDGEGADVAPDAERRLALPSRPKLDLEVPYRMYRLVTADGRPVERTDKHPFCMSRVYYDAAEKPEEVWAELADGSCRWRQTGSEVRIQALKVPRALPPRQLAVTIEPYALKVANRSTGEVYLEGSLQRGVVPEDCYWTLCADEGCSLSLHKMNLEVLRRQWAHSEMWWARLFAHHGDISWDDYEKDYSDLPEEVLERHRVAEAIKEGERQVEGAERGRREALQEADDLRKRRRQERLGELRSGVRRDWVLLHRDNPGGGS